MSMGMLFLRENKYATPQFLGRDGNFSGRDCHFLRTSWLFQNLGRDGNFFGRDCLFFRTSWQFQNRVGHVLRTIWSPFNEFGKVKILGGYEFRNY